MVSAAAEFIEEDKIAIAKKLEEQGLVFEDDE